MEKPVAVRYAWGNSPEGNLKVNGQPFSPQASFRTDHWDWPETDDPAEIGSTGTIMKEIKTDAEARFETRRTKEAERAIQMKERLETLGKN